MENSIYNFKYNNPINIISSEPKDILDFTYTGIPKKIPLTIKEIKPEKIFDKSFIKKSKNIKNIENQKLKNDMKRAINILKKFKKENERLQIELDKCKKNILF